MTEPPIKPGFTRLYRGQAEKSPRKIPDWIAEDGWFKASQDAAGRWFTDLKTPHAEWYAKEAGLTGHIVYIDIPSREVKRYSVDSCPEARRFSRDPEHEFFVPHELSQSAKKLVVIPKIGIGY